MSSWLGDGLGVAGGLGDGTRGQYHHCAVDSVDGERVYPLGTPILNT